MTKLLTGDKAPDFTLPTDGDGTFTLSDHAGSPIILFFYPKDDTPGCTKEAIGFSEKLAEFDAVGAKVIGMSPDPIKKHDKFRDKHNLATTLVSDEDKTTLDAYGVWVEKSMYGKKYMGVERTTLLLDANGMIAHAWHKVKVPGHVDDVLAATKALVG